MLIYIHIDYAIDLSWFTTKLYPSNGKKKKKREREREGEGEEEEEGRGLEGGQRRQDGELGLREK